MYDACQNVWVKETFGATLRTPFTDLLVFRSAQRWSRWCEERGARPDKTILKDALAEFVPDAIWNRRGKVAYDGVWMRGGSGTRHEISRACGSKRSKFRGTLPRSVTRPPWFSQSPA